MISTNKILFSVVICSFNSRKYIQPAVESILNQTLQDIEIIVVDDGSTDGTLEYLLAIQDPRLHVIALTKNGGLINARMIGFRQARSEFIAVMDADDIADGRRLELQLEVLKNHKADVCGSFHVSLRNSDGYKRFKPAFVNNNDLRALLTIYSPLCNPSVSFRRSILDSIGYKLEYMHAEDYGFWCDISLANYSFYNIPEPLLTYRVHESQVSQVKLGAARASFDLARKNYIFILLGLTYVPQSMHFIQRIYLANKFLKILTLRVGPLSFRACYEIYAEFQFRRNGLLTVFTRLERTLASLYAAYFIKKYRII